MINQDAISCPKGIASLRNLVLEKSEGEKGQRQGCYNAS